MKFNYLFLGLKGSGKTTFFSLMIRELQRVANNKKNINLGITGEQDGESDNRELQRVANNKKNTNPEITGEQDGESDNCDSVIRTTNFIRLCNELIDKQQWPEKTQGYEDGYSFELEIKHLFYNNISEFYYHDYPGEAFSIAYGGEKNESEDLRVAAQKLNDQVKKAEGIFLLIDAENMFNGIDDSMVDTSLSGLFNLIKKKKPDIKVAIIFNKLELFGGIEYSLDKLISDFEARYYNAIGNLPKMHKYFAVYTLGKVEINSEGKAIPPNPKERKPRMLLEPVKWMLELRDNDI